MNKKNFKLEFIRGFASLIVVICHLFILFPEIRINGLTGISNWGTESVILFFILSGIVINMSITYRSKSAFEFIKDRLIRIYPQFFVSVIFSILLLYFFNSSILNYKIIWGNLLMLDTLQCHIACTLPSNSALWSLSFEMAFYLIFSFAILNKTKNKLWLLFSLIIMPLYFTSYNKGFFGYLISIISFSSIWLVGLFLFEYRNRIKSNIYLSVFSVSLIPLISRTQITHEYYDPFKFLLLAIALIPFFKFCISSDHKNSLSTILSSIFFYILFSILTFIENSKLTFVQIIYIILPVFSLLISFIIKRFSIKSKYYIEKTSLILGKYSYSIYIIHYPLFYCLKYAITTPFVRIIIGIISLIFMAIFLEDYLQIFITKRAKNYSTV